MNLHRSNVLLLRSAGATAVVAPNGISTQTADSAQPAYSIVVCCRNELWIAEEG
ncbi:MAG TPA: hypothetical protein VGC84_06060 [Ilumatobacteraceae bacterium]